MKVVADSIIVNLSDDSSSWVLLDSGNLKGINVLVDEKSSDVVALSTRFSKDVDRWNNDMPSLREYDALQILDLHNSRYLVKLDESVMSLMNLRSLVLTNCQSLRTLPDSLGKLSNLQEVSLRCTHSDDVANCVSVYL
jgi:Leucine-rich repeat (LRR) protein